MRRAAIRPVLLVPASLALVLLSAPGPALGSAGSAPQDGVPAAAPGAPRPAGDLRPKACREGLPPDARCYDLPVYEDPRTGSEDEGEDAAAGRREERGRERGGGGEVEGARVIDLNVVVLPATGEDPAPEPIFILVGGPGQAATTTGVYPWMREGWDIVLVDQRGTGGSNALSCALHGPDEGPAEWLGDWLPREAVRACRARLEERADLRLYTTPIAVDDLEAVRRGLGYDRINLEGGSYGTRVALVYLRRHPGSVRAALLHGAVRPDFHMPLTYPEDAQRALEGVLADCEEDPACDEAFPDVRESYRRALARFEDGAVPVEVRDPASGEPAAVELSRGTWAQSLRFHLYSGASAARIPLLLHRAGDGDHGELAEFILGYRRALQSQLHAGMFLSVTCAEDVPRVDPAEAERRAEGTFLGTWRWEQQRRACEEWPEGLLPGDYGAVVRSDVPVLVISGELDPVTPPRRSRTALEGLPNGRHLTVPGAGHSWGGLVNGDCVQRIREEFLRRGTAQGLATDCLETVHRVPFATEASEEEAIELSREALSRLEGRYTGPQLTLEVALDEGRLTATGPGLPVLALVPVAPLRFRIEGGPSGTYLEFLEAEEGGGIRAVRLLEGGAEAAVLDREAP